MQQSPDGTTFAEMLAFVAVAEEGSFTRAAKRLQRDSTVVSRRVSALEARLGARLLERTTRALTLTEAGRDYLSRVQGALRALAEADEVAGASASGEPRGHLRIALPATFGRLWLTDLVVEFMRLHPQVTVEAVFSNRIVDLVEEHFDVAVRLGTLTDSRLVARKIGRRGHLLCAAPALLERYALPRHPSDLADLPCLRFTGLVTGPRWQFRRGSETIRVAVDGPFAADDAEALLAAAEAGFGVVLSADWLAGAALRAGRLVPMLTDWTASDEGAISVVTPSAIFPARKTRAFSDFIAARLRKAPWAAPPHRAPSPALVNVDKE